MTTSAPCSTGLRFTGLANVESTTSATPASLVIDATGRRSSTRQLGLTGVAMKPARVCLRSAVFQARVSTGSTSETSIPRDANSSVRSVRVPP